MSIGRNRQAWWEVSLFQLRRLVASVLGQCDLRLPTRVKFAKERRAIDNRE
jgi:hypothetical protein